MEINNLNNQIALLNLPGIILLGIGIIGNVLALYIHIFKIRQSNHRVFIVCLTVLDLTVCAIDLPAMVSQQLWEYLGTDTERYVNPFNVR